MELKNVIFLFTIKIEVCVSYCLLVSSDALPPMSRVVTMRVYYLRAVIKLQS